MEGCLQTRAETYSCRTLNGKFLLTRRLKSIQESMTNSQSSLPQLQNLLTISRQLRLISLWLRHLSSRTKVFAILLLRRKIVLVQVVTEQQVVRFGATERGILVVGCRFTSMQTIPLTFSVQWSTTLLLADIIDHGQHFAAADHRKISLSRHIRMIMMTL